MGSFEIQRGNYDWDTVTKLVRSGIYHGTPVETTGKRINNCYLLLCSVVAVPNDFLHPNFLAFEILFPVLGLLYFCGRVYIMFNVLYWFDVVISFNSFDDRTSAEGLENFKKNNKMKH